MRKIFFLAAFLFTKLVVAQSPQLMIPMGHAGDITVLAVSPDKKWLASGDENGTVKLWDMQSAKEVKTFDNNPKLSNLNSIKTLTFSSDSKKLYVGVGSSLIINDLSSAGKEIFKQKIHENSISQILVSNNGKTLVTAADNEVKIWDTNNLTLAKTVAIKGKKPKLSYGDANNLIVITTGNYQVLSSSFDLTDIITNKGYITHINIATGQITAIDEFENLENDKMCVSPNGKLLAITRYEQAVGNIQLLDLASNKILKKFTGIRESSINLLSFSNNSRYMATKAGTSIMLYDLASLTYVKTFHSEDIFSSSISFGADDTKFFQGINSNGSVVQWDLKENRVDKIFTSEANFIKDLAVTPDQQSLVLLYGINEYRSKKFFLQKLDLKSAVLSKLQHPGIENKLQKLTIASAGGGKLFEDRIANSVDVILKNKNISAFAISKNRKVLVTTDEHAPQPQLTFYNVEDGKNINTINLQKAAYSLLFSKDGKILYVGYQGNNRIDKIEIATGVILRTFEHTDSYSKANKINHMLLSPDENTLIGLNDFFHMYSWNTATGVESKLNVSTSGMGFSLKSVPNTNAFIYGDGENNLKVYDLSTNKIIRSFKLNSRTIGTLDLTPDGKFIFYRNNDKSLGIWDFTKGELIASMIFFGEKDWVVVDKAGRFDGTQEGMKQMYYVKGLDIIPLESAFEKFFTPGLLASLLTGEIIPAPPITINTLKVPPTVKISFIEGGRNLIVEDDVTIHNTTNSAAQIQVNASCPTDAVTEIKLYQNGKLIQGTRNLVVADDVAASPKMDKTFTVVLEAGKNIFKAIAFNTERTESTPISLTINYAPAKKDVSITSNITLHMLVVGINKYKNPKYNLNYAQADAEAFKKAMTSGSSSLFSSSQITYLSDAEATQSGIKDAFQKIKTNAKPQDLFIFYYAGHGVINDKKEFFLVPYDVTQLYGNDEALAQKGFSAATLQEWSKEIKAQKQLFILDACQSAGALTSMAGSRGAAEEKAIAQLARSTGTQWLTASGSEQFASEFGSLGHGSFTYCILQALGGSANTGSQLTVKQLDAYLQSKVPEITEKFKGTPQYPASYSYGNDFPIYIFK